MFFQKYGDLVVGVFYGVLSILVIAAARALPKSKVMEVGPDFMPTVVGVIMLILALILIVQSVRKLMKQSPDTKYAEDNSDYKRVFGSLILALAYVNVLKPVGFILSTLIYLAHQIYVLAPDDARGKKDILRYLLIDVIFTFIVFFLFRYGFKIVLPAGIFTL